MNSLISCLLVKTMLNRSTKVIAEIDFNAQEKVVATDMIISNQIISNQSEK